MKRLPTATEPPAGDSIDRIGSRRAPTLAGEATAGLRGLLERNVFTVLVLAACAAVQAVFVRGAVVADGWYSLLGGRVVAAGGLPGRDTLTAMTLGRDWVDQQWLAHLTLYELWNAAGWRLAAISLLVFYLGTFAVASIAARRLGASDRSVAAIVFVSFIAGLPNTVFRAQIIAYPLFALVLSLLLADSRRAGRLVYLVFPLLALWANIHGSVVVGAALVTLRGLTFAAERLRARAPLRSFAGGALALLLLPWPCTLISPYGLALPGYYRSVLDNSTLTHSIVEWSPSTLRGQPIFFALLLAGLWIAARSGPALTRFSKLALLCLGILGLVAVRNDVWFAIAGAVVLPAALDRVWAPGKGERRAGLNLALATAGAVVAVVAVASVASHGRSWFERSYPPRAAEVVAAAADSSPGLRIFANEEYADWLLFEKPQLTGRIAYDVRFELLPSARLQEIVDFRLEHGLDWQRAVNGYGLLVLDPAGDRGAVRLFTRLPGTTVLFRDAYVVVLRRRT